MPTNTISISFQDGPPWMYFARAMDTFMQKYGQDQGNVKLHCPQQQQHQATPSTQDMHTSLPQEPAMPALMNGSASAPELPPALPAPKSDSGPTKPTSSDGIAPPDNETSCQNDKPTTLIDWEKQAFDTLMKKKQNKKQDYMKKPAAASKCKDLSKSKACAKTGVATKASAATKSIAKARVPLINGWAPSSEVYGCTRCRGNIRGCDSCHSPLFSGVRFSSRKEWADYEKKRLANKK